MHSYIISYIICICLCFNYNYSILKKHKKKHIKESIYIYIYILDIIVFGCCEWWAVKRVFNMMVNYLSALRSRRAGLLSLSCRIKCIHYFRGAKS